MDDRSGPVSGRISLDDTLEASLWFTGDPSRNSTIVVLPGLGVRRGEQERKARRALRKALGWGATLNIATFLYPSHRTELLSGFDADAESLASVLVALREAKVPADCIGFLAICYGANVLCQYREQGDVGRFAVLIEPLFSYRGLRLWFSVFARAGLAFLTRTGRDWTWARKSRVDPRSFHQLMVRPVHLRTLGLPFLTISNRRHDLIFDQRYLSAQLQGTDSLHRILDGKRFSRGSVAGYYQLVTDFLRDWVVRLQGDGEVALPPTERDSPFPPEPRLA